MNILAVDTATKACSVAVMADETMIAEMTINHGQTHAKLLMNMIHRTLKFSSLTINDIDGFAVTTGPGSFTGLRIGLSTIKGFAAATAKPIVGVSTLAALSYPFSSSGKLICPLLDARRGEVYTARYRFDGLQMNTLQEPRAATLMNAIVDIDEPCIFVGDGVAQNKNALLDKLGPMAMIANSGQHPINASNVASLSMSRFKINDTDDINKLVPLYIRKSDAEKNQVRNVSSPMMK